MHDKAVKDRGREWSGAWGWVYIGTDFFLALFPIFPPLISVCVGMIIETRMQGCN